MCVWVPVFLSPAHSLCLSLSFAHISIHALKVLEKYPPHLFPDIQNTMCLMGTHFIFTCPTRAVARAMSQRNDTYLYWFDHVMSFSKKAWGPRYT